MAYVTVSDLNQELGQAWAASDKSKDLAVKMVNAWLAGVLKRPPSADMRASLVTAAGFIAPLAVNGTLFKSAAKEVTSKSSEAKGVKTSKSYREGSVDRTLEENMALSVLSQWLGGSITTAKVRIV